jgi:hypothetical protein
MALPRVTTLVDSNGAQLRLGASSQCADAAGRTLFNDCDTLAAFLPRRSSATECLWEQFDSIQVAKPLAENSIDITGHCFATTKGTLLPGFLEHLKSLKCP